MTTRDACVGHSQSSHFDDSRWRGRWRGAEAVVGEGFRVTVRVHSARSHMPELPPRRGGSEEQQGQACPGPGPGPSHACGPTCPRSRDRIPPDSGFVCGRKDERKNLQTDGTNPLILLPSAGTNFSDRQMLLRFLTTFLETVYGNVERQREGMEGD